MNRNQGGNGTLRPQRGFTLIELLVVISLIALMMGILLPLLGKSRQVALSGACLSNQRQLMIAIESHTIENKGLYPNRMPTTAAGAVLSNDPLIQYAQNDEIQGIELPDLLPARPRSWVAAASSNIRQISVGYTAYQQDNKPAYQRLDAPEFVCPADEDPVGPTFGGWMSDESIDRSYVFNGFNDFKYAYTSWTNQIDNWAVPRDLLVKPSATATLSEKKSGLGRAHQFHMDVFADFNPVDVLVQDRHNSGATHTFADGSVRLMDPYESASPENLWGLKQATRDELTYVPDRYDDNWQ